MNKLQCNNCSKTFKQIEMITLCSCCYAKMFDILSTDFVAVIKANQRLRIAQANFDAIKEEINLLVR